MIGAKTCCRSGLCVAAGVWVGLVSGCTTSPHRTRLTSPYDRTVAIAVAPALNLSGSTDFDPVSAADLLASELGHVDDVLVIPVSRVLAVLAAQGRRQIESPSQALEVCEALGADAIVVMAVTEYDPYDPPVVGMAAQLYALPSAPGSGFDPVAASRQPSPPGAGEACDSPLRPKAQAQRVFNAAYDDVTAAIREYARDRDADDGPLGWRKYVKSQRMFLRFCCWATVRELIRQEWHRQTGQVVS